MNELLIDISPWFFFFALFAENLELKKLVYLYLINYAKTQPELALLAVNTFVKDANDPNPLIRALAVRTMGCIRVEKITEYLCEPLNRCLRDEDPYVRKTAAVCVAKLYDISPELVMDRGFVDILRDLISDANPTVVANAVAALSEIAESSGQDVMMVTPSILQKLLAALNECTEWGQVFILDSLAKYTPSDAREAEGIIERVTPRLSHANSAVVLSAVKVIINFMELVTNQDTIRSLSRKLAPPLVTLLNSEPEIQYVALRNINLIVQKRPRILEHEIKVFFCKYNDPIYVKMEKLEIIIRLANERNVDQVLLEFKEYATEVDVDFVRKSVRAIGRCAIKLERAAERCITVLLELIQTGVNYVVQEAVIVIKDIFRRYPNRYESIIATLCENLDTLDEPEAKASMIWIIGEYAERIENADELLESFLETFQDETAQVQLQLLTATVKLFLKNPEGTQDMVQRVLSLATEESDNPDLRDRGYVYWRLLVANPDAARAVVLAEKPTIADDTFSLEPSLLDELMKQIATLASVYHKPPEAFVVRALPAASGEEEEDIIEEYLDEDGEESSAFSGEHEESKRSADGGRTAAPAATNLLDLGFDEEPTSAFSSTPSTPAVRKQLVVPAESGNGVTVSAAVARQGGQVQLLMDFTNQTPTPMQQFAIQLNTSTFGLAPVSQAINLPAPIVSGSTQSTAVPLAFNAQMVNPSSPQPLQLQAAIKNIATNHVFYFMVPFQLEAVFTADGAMDVNSLVAAWRAIDESLEATQVVNDLPTTEIELIKQKLAAANVHFVAQRPVPQQEGQTVVFFSAKTVNNVQFIFELTFRAGFSACKLVVKSPDQRMSELAKQSVARVISA